MTAPRHKVPWDSLISERDRNDPDYPDGIGRPVWDWGTDFDIAMRRPSAHPGRALVFFALVGLFGWSAFLWVPMGIILIARLIDGH